MQHTKLPIDSINVTNRIRKNLGDIESLSRSIEELGLLSPIIVNEDYKLLAGERRLEACKRLNWEAVDVIVMDTASAENELDVEIAENENRKGFTREELINAGIEFERIEKVKAEYRSSMNLKQYCPRGGKLPPWKDEPTEVVNLPPRRDEDTERENFPTRREEDTTSNSSQQTQGKTREIVAKKLGMSGKQYEREKYILENRDLLSEEEFTAWNERTASTNKTYKIIAAILKPAKVETKEVTVEVPPADYEELKSALAEREKQIYELSQELGKQKESHIEAETTFSLQDDLDEANRKLSNLQKEYDELLSKQDSYKEEIESLRNELISDDAKEADLAYNFYKEADRFVKDVVSKILYDDVITHNQNNESGDYIINACNMLIDSANDVLKRFTADVVNFY